MGTIFGYSGFSGFQFWDEYLLLFFFKYIYLRLRNNYLGERENPYTLLFFISYQLLHINRYNCGKRKGGGGGKERKGSE